jgi:hypothetical protein
LARLAGSSSSASSWSSLSGDAPVVEVSTSSALRQVTGPGQRATAKGHTASSAGAPVFLFSQPGSSSSGSRSGHAVAAFVFPVPRPHAEQLLVAVRTTGSGSGAAASGGLVGRGQVPLSLVSSAARDVEISLVTDLGAFGGTVKLRACLRPVAAPAVEWPGGSTAVEQAAVRGDDDDAAAAPAVVAAAAWGVSPTHSPSSQRHLSLDRPEAAGSAAPLRRGSACHVSVGGGGSGGAAKGPAAKSASVRFFGNTLRSVSLLSSGRPRAEATAGQRRSSTPFFGSSSSSTSTSTSSSSSSSTSSTSSFTPSRSRRGDHANDEAVSLASAAAADEVARRVSASAKGKLSRGLLTRAEYDVIMATNQALYEAVVGCDDTLPTFADRGGSGMPGGGTRSAQPAVGTGGALGGRSADPRRAAAATVLTSDAWEVFGDDGDDTDMYAAPSALAVLAPRGVATSPAAEVWMPADEVAQLKSMGFDPLAVDAASEVVYHPCNAPPSSFL